MANDRSPNYPGFSLKTSVDVARLIYEKERQSWMTHDIAARAMGYSSLSGPPRRKIGALRKFGLLESSGGTVRLTPLAMTILFSRSEDEKQIALREAAVKPELYRELSKESGASDDNLTAGLIRRGFIPDGAKRAVASFRETMELVSGGEIDYDQDEDEDLSMIDAPTPPARNLDSKRGGDLGGHSTGEFTWPLPQGVTAQLRFGGGPLTKEGLRLLRAYLDLVEQALPDPSPASPTVPPQPSVRSPDDAQD